MSYVDEQTRVLTVANSMFIVMIVGFTLVSLMIARVRNHEKIGQ